MESKKFKENSENIHSYESEIKGWEYFYNRNQPSYPITGKYLIFSDNRNLLVDIAIEELENNNFHQAKINLPPPIKEYVLCIYYKDDSRKYELAKKYKNHPELKYRYWKSNERTRQGEYSRELFE